MTRSIAILSAALAFLSHALSVAALASDEHAERNNSGGGGSAAALRGKKQPAEQRSLEHLIPMNDSRRTTTPFDMPDLEGSDDIVGHDYDENINRHGGRELQKLNKRQQRKQMLQQSGGGNSTTTTTPGECSGSRPKRCGCPSVFQSDYRGKRSTTENGFNCRAWSTSAFDHYPDSGLEAGAVCRNPNGVANRAWCFVDHPEVMWDYCGVRRCADDGFSSVQGTGTTGVQVNVPGCVDTGRYRKIDTDIAALIEEKIGDDDGDRAHFMGGILRLAAHDFMDHDHAADNKMGMDGCLDWNSDSNSGLSSIWNEHSPLFQLHRDHYPDISRPDFWVISASAIVRQASIGNTLDLENTFYWGRNEVDSCPEAASRLPSTENCQQVEGVFLERMGLKWKDAVALLGAHTMGKGHREFSGHHGTWVPSEKHATVFDKKYFEELVSRSWSPRQASSDPPLQDWTTGNNLSKPKMMLNTDICLFYNVEEMTEPCCTRIDIFDGSGNSRCERFEDTACEEYPANHERAEAAAAVRNYLGGSTRNDNNEHFYQAFKIAWYKAVMNGMDNLKPLMDTC